QLYSAEYFTEEVRRDLAKLYGEDQLYGGGLSVRTTLEPRLQEYARRALMDGLIQYGHTRGFRGPVACAELGAGSGPGASPTSPLSDVPEWQLAVVLEIGNNEARIGLRPDRDVDGAISTTRVEGTLSGPTIKWVSQQLQNVLNVGDVVYVSPVAGQEGVYTLE